MRKMTQTVVIAIEIAFALTATYGCTRQISDTNDIHFLTSQTRYTDIFQVNGTISNLSSASIEVEGIANLAVYTKKLNGWMPNQPCASSIILDTEKRLIPPDTKWEIGIGAFNAKTCISPQLIPGIEVETYLFAIEYQAFYTSTGIHQLVSYSNEFQVGDAKNISDFVVAVEQPGLFGFNLRNNSDQPIWFVPLCPIASSVYDEMLYSEVPYVLQRQTDEGAWEIFRPTAEKCSEVVEPIEIDVGQILSIEIHMVFPGDQEGLSPEQYRWEVVYFPEWTPSFVGQSPPRHIFSPVFEYSGTGP